MMHETLCYLQKNGFTVCILLFGTNHTYICVVSMGLAQAHSNQWVPYTALLLRLQYGFRNNPNTKLFTGLET